MQLYVVRHGETAWNKEEIFRGRKDVPLNETGKRQAHLTGRYFRDKGITGIFSSPLGRAVETAEGIRTITKVPLKRTDALIDMGFGTWEGLELSEVDRLYPEELKTWRQAPHKFRNEGGERLADVRRRLRKGLQKIVADEQGPIVLVTHRVICKMIVLLSLRIPSSHFWEIRCDPASISLIEKVGDSTALAFLNDTCHLHHEGSNSVCHDF